MHAIGTMASVAPLLEGARREKTGGDRTMAGGAGGPLPSTLSQELIVAALLELDERPDVALPAGLREVGAMSGARGIAAGQNAAVGEKRLEGRGVPVVTLLASDDVSPVSRRFPVVGVLRDRVGLRVGDVAVGAAIPLSPEGSGDDDDEKEQPRAKAHSNFLPRSRSINLRQPSRDRGEEQREYQEQRDEENLSLRGVQKELAQFGHRFLLRYLTRSTGQGAKRPT
jgi:hypothetical protein